VDSCCREIGMGSPKKTSRGTGYKAFNVFYNAAKGEWL